ncbi:MAG: bifunctional 2-polyprenyl-6-hydroxyphenol methylase/3-demethylubiquinol 3-O-methyltransferase UbiG [Aestuariibacter sp.]
MSAAKHHNLDEQEIAKFSELASRWWDLEGEFKPLHQINPLRLQFIMDATNGLFDKTALDVGCGGGILSEAMAKAGAHVTGIDMAQESLQVAKLHGLESGVKVEYQCSTAEEFAMQHENSFDVVTCLEMLEHVPDPASVVQACSKLVKEDGIVAFSTLNRNIKSFGMAIVAAEYVMGLVPKGTHDFRKFIKPSELLKYADNAGLKAIAMTGLHYQPLSGEYYLSDQNVDVNYIVVCKKI